MTVITNKRELFLAAEWEAERRADGYAAEESVARLLTSYRCELGEKLEHAKTEAYEDGIHAAERGPLRRAQAAALWQSWGALVAMAVLAREADATADHWMRSCELVGRIDVELRRLEALRTWQAWSGVLVMAAWCEWVDLHHSDRQEQLFPSY
jgi:hypothetical protein